MTTTIRFLFVFLLLAPLTVSAQSTDSIEGEAGILFGYFPKEGKESAFDEGYKKHLEWHRNNNDPFVWYGWYVITGDRVGMFIDGTFGLSFQAFDNRVKPREDAAHFEQTTAPYADVAYRKVFTLKKELSTVTPLEQKTPSRHVEAYTFSIRPGMEPLFEEVLSTLSARVKKEQPARSFTLYRQLTGGRLPSYLLMVPHDGFAAFDSGKTITTLSNTIIQTFDESESKNLTDRLSRCIQNIHGETWLYRPDLSYFPER